MRRWSFALSLALARCSDDDIPPDLGARPEDRVVLSDEPRLAYLAEALADGADAEVQDLFHVERARFTAAPDPTPLFELQAAAHAALPPLTDPTTLRVLTYNLGLLDRWFPFTHVGAPYMGPRRERLPKELLAQDFDVICLQEIWELEDIDRFAAEAKERGYALYPGSEKKHIQHGLAILVRESILGDAEQERHEEQFEAQREIEFFPGPLVKRGFLRWSFTHADTGRRIHVYTTHMTSFPELWHERLAQARAIGGAVKAHDDDDIALVTGDFNAGPYYPDESFGAVDGEPVTEWWNNSTMYPLFLFYGDMVDTHSVLSPATDVVRMQQLLLPFDAAKYLAKPLAGRCAEIPFDAFTATDCNSIYSQQYIATEYPARLDYVLLHDPGAHARVVVSEILYSEPIDFGAAGTFELSDHYAYATTLQLAR